MLDRNAILTLIRDVIAEEVRHLKAGARPPTPAAGTPSPVSIATDADLASFAQNVLKLAEDAGVRTAIESGRYPFRLAQRSTDHKAAGASAVRPHRVDKGVITESVIARLPAGVTRLDLGPGVTITPLARDKARSMGIGIERTDQ